MLRRNNLDREFLLFLPYRASLSPRWGEGDERGRDWGEGDERGRVSNP